MKYDFCLYELGSTSLKFYYRLRVRDQMGVYKQAWSIGHEVCRTRFIPKTCMDEAIAALGRVRSKFESRYVPRCTIAVATGIFREAQNASDFVELLKTRVGLNVRILSADEEAALLESSYVDAGLPRPGFVFDLGGASLQWVHFSSRERSSRGSVGLGAIRLSRLVDGLDGDLNGLTHQIVDKLLVNLPSLNLERIRSTGGTARAIRKVLGKDVVLRNDLAELEEKIRRGGPPETLPPHRRPIFLAGVVIVHRLMLDAGATALHYDRLSIGYALLRKVFCCYEREPTTPTPSAVFRRVRYSASFSRERPASSIQQRVS